MFKQLFKYGLFFFWAIFFDSCISTIQNEDKLIAEVGNKKLLLSEVAAVIPNNMEGRDSMMMADEYIRKWIRQELVLQKAEENLSTDLKNVARELEEYRNSLIIFRYKNKLIAQRMDTTVNYNEILEYYLEHTENFKLNRNIVKAVFMKIPAEYANPDVLKEMSSNTTTEGISEIRDYCIQYAKGFDIFTDRWVDLERVMNNIPIAIDSPEQFLKKNQFIEHNDSSYYYLVTIHEFMLKNEQAPEEYVREDIKSLILNRRKITFLRDLENNIYQEGINRKKFKIYNTETDEI